MVTISTSLKMFDQMTRPLQQVTQALNLTINAMDSLNNSASKDIKITNSLNSARGAIQKANVGLHELANAQNKANNSQNRLNQSFDKGANSSNNLTHKIKSLAAGYLGIQAGKLALESTIGGAMGLQQQLFTLQGIMGNKGVATAYFDNLKKKGNESVFAFEEFASNARKFMQFTKNTNSLDKLANLSERLTLMDPAQGLEGAGFALKEMMSGDGVSLKERFGFGKADIEILKASKDMDSFISKFDTLLNKKGFTENMLQQYNKSAVAQFDNLKSNFKTAFAEAGNGALEILAPVITRLNNAFANGSFQNFFNVISTGLSFIVELAVSVADVFCWIGNVITSNWIIIAPIIWGIVAALIAYNATMGFAWLTTLKTTGAKIIHAIVSWAETAAILALIIAQDGLNAALMACPLTWIIIAIIMLIALFYAAVGAVNKLAGTSISATGIICGVFMTGLAFIGNLFITLFNLIIDIVALMYNPFAMFAEFLANVFVDPIGSIVRLFAGMADEVLGILESIASAIDTIFGSNLADAVSGWRNGLDGAVKDLVGEAKIKIPKIDSSKMHLKRFEYSKSWDSGYNFGKKIENFDLGNMLNGLNKAPKTPKMPDMNKWNKAQGPGDLAMSLPKNKMKSPKGLKDANKHLKNIDDKIDVSNEHLEMLRDLAEQESIQNFVTLTPTVKVKTGDVKQEADINKIISKIETYMENELANSAEGVYA